MDTAGEELTGEQIRLLIVEDVETDVELLLIELRHADVPCSARVVQTAPEYREALEMFDPHVILSDFSLPHFHGRLALSIAHESHPDIPFIFVSGTIGEENAIRAMKDGATDYIFKTNLIRLAPAVRRAVEEARVRRERRALDQELLESERRYHELFQSNPHPMWVYDIETLSFLTINDTAIARYGYSRKEFLSMTLNDILEETELPRLQALMAQPMPVVNVPATWKLRVKGGEPIHVGISSHNLMFDGRAARIVVSYDMTERHRAEEKLQESERIKSAIIESALDCLITTDQDGKIVEFNPAAETTFGVPREQALSMALADLIIPPHSRNAHNQSLAHYLSTGEGQILGKRVELMARRANGAEFPAEVSVTSFGSQTKQFFTGFIRDITERKRQEDKINRLTRIYAVLSGINSAIVRIRDRQELFEEACRIAVEHGGFRMAWIGLVNKSTASVEPAAWAGSESGFFESMTESSSKGRIPSWGESVAGWAIRLKEPVITNDFGTDPRIANGAEFVARDYRSGVVLPLLVGVDAVGVLSLYASEIDIFDAQEMKLLMELAGDISFAMEYIEKEEKLNYLAYYDALTGLPNSALLHDRLAQFVHAAKPGSSSIGAMVINLDRFKYVNDTFGRHAGDSLLKMVAERFDQTLQNPFSVARTGADNFAIVVADLKQGDEVVNLLQDRIFASLERPFDLNGDRIRVSAKAGIAVYPGDGTDSETLLRNAEAALKRAKSSGEKYLFYAPEMNARVAEKLTLENKLRTALDQKQFVLYYQPKVAVRDRKITGLEALIRWNDPETGLIPPASFIPLMEETGLIHDAGSWVISQATRDCRLWAENGVKPPRVAVNVSSIQLRQKEFLDLVIDAAKQMHDAGSALDIEITESSIMENVETVIPKLQTMRELGVRIFLDDFGTGYSSLTYVARLPIHALKIDRSFVARMIENADSLAIVSSVISLAHSLRLTVIAEGVETENQAAWLAQLACDEMQGYLFNPPLPPDRVMEVMRSA
jgi:diguanylate cyclase (GGDEF)-like protein/PAS domain S-box-containing protein